MNRKPKFHSLVLAHLSRPTAPLPPAAGPGTELRRILSGVGVKPCNRCLKLARQMDEWGPEGCQARLPELVADLVAEVKRRKWLISRVPFKHQAATLLIEQAIKAARAASTLPTP